MQGTRSRRLMSVAALCSALIVVAACGPAPSAELDAAGNDAYAKHWAHRGANGLPQLALDSGMNANAKAAADRNAGFMASCSTPMQHTSQDQLRAWYGNGAENLACVPGCPADAAVVWNLWLNSAGHRANIERASYGRIGIGVTCTGGFQVYAVHFASP